MFIRMSQNHNCSRDYKPRRPYRYSFNLVKSIREGKKVRQKHIAALDCSRTDGMKDGKIPANGWWVWKDVLPQLVKFNLTKKEIDNAKRFIRGKFMYWDRRKGWDREKVVDFHRNTLQGVDDGNTEN